MGVAGSAPRRLLRGQLTEADGPRADRRWVVGVGGGGIALGLAAIAAAVVVVVGHPAPSEQR